MKPDFDRAVKKAYQVLISLNIKTLPIEPLTILYQCKNTVIRTYADVMALFRVSDLSFFKSLYLEWNDAITLRQVRNGRPIYELFYDSQANSRRMRFTLAHELGHIILNHRQEEDWEEKEADCFASHLLAPRPLFVPLRIHQIDAADPNVISDIFSLSKTAAKVVINKRYYIKYDDDQYTTLMFQFAEYINTIIPIYQKYEFEKTGGEHR